VAGAGSLGGPDAAATADSNVAVVEHLFEAFARRDADGMVEVMAADVLFEPASSELASREPYEGHRGMRRYLADLARTWAEFRVTIHGYHGAGDRVLARGRVYARSASPAFIADSEIAFVWSVHDGRIVHGRTFTDLQDAETELLRSD
jgi:ketosteroid isomerase-like protein